MKEMDLSCPNCGGKLISVIPGVFKCEHCNIFFEMHDGKPIPGGQARVYERAMEFTKVENKDDYQALRLFEMLGADYGNAAEMAAKIREKIHNDELQKEIEENHRMVKKQLMKIFTMIAAIVLVIFLIVNGIKTRIIEKKMVKYNEAVAFFESGEYEKAIDCFGKIKTFSNSKEYIEEAHQLLEKQKDSYKRAVDYVEAGLYNKALSEFALLPEHYEKKDVYIEQCAAQLYSDAETYYSQENIDKARAILNDFPADTEYSIKAEGLLSTIDNEIESRKKEEEYYTAIRLYNEGNYIDSQRSFLNLGEYKSATTYNYLNDIGSSLYSKASELYNNGDYIGCSEIISYIDEENEWSSYKVSIELWDEAMKAYIAPLKEEAKHICRESGHAAMTEFVDSKICSLLDQSTADTLKSECKITQVWLKELHSYYWGNVSRYDSCDDNQGMTWTDSFVACSKEDNYIKWDIEGKYQYLNFKVAVFEPYWHESVSEGQFAAIYIYGDGALIWKDEQINIGTKTHDVSVNVGGVSDLKIEMMRNQALRPMICDAVLTD